MSAKLIVLKVLKVTAGIAAVVFWFVPLRTGTQLLLFAGSIVVLLVCSAVSLYLNDEHAGYWPDEPRR